MTNSRSLLGYADVQKWLQQHPLRQTEIPTEHAVSLPMPTRRWGEPAYSFFACPAERRPGQPPRHDAPDRWWVFSAKGGQVLIYTLSRFFSFAGGQRWDTITVSPASESVVVLQQMVQDIRQMMDAVIPAFFADTEGDAEIRAALHGVLVRFLSPPLLAQYRALAPDYFQWLEARPSAKV